jgi:endoglucanase
VSTTAKATSTSASSPAASPLSFCPAARTKFQYFGVNESGAEFGEGNLPGTLGKDYIWPTTSSIDAFMNQGMNFFRVPFLWERLSPNGMTGAFDQTYLADLTSLVNHITGKGGFVAIEPHNYFRYSKLHLRDISLTQIDHIHHRGSTRQCG